MAGKAADDPTMSWMSDEEYLAEWHRHVRPSGGALPATPQQLREWIGGPAPRPEPPRSFLAVDGELVESEVTLIDRCPGCARPAAEGGEAPIQDGRRRWWHRECARRALAEVAGGHGGALCPACGRPPPTRGFLFDGARRLWHVHPSCTGRALAPLERAR